MLFEPVIHALNEDRVRYVVVGGLAVVLHGHARLTADLDLIVDLAPEEASRAMECLTRLGLRPRAPVDPRSFADPAQRRSWIEEKGMTVLGMWAPARPMLSVDVFVDTPIPFDELFAAATLLQLRTTTVRVASIEHVIRLKQIADRPVDRDDIAALQRLQKLRGTTRGG